MLDHRNIGIVCETWGSGGIESFLYNVLSHMDLSGLEITVIAARMKPSVFTSGLEEKGIRFIELSGNARNLPKNERAFCRLLAERQFDVIHFNLFQGFSLRYVHLAEKANVPVRIAHSHNAALRKSPIRPLKLMLHEFGRRRYTGCATDLWACSQVAADFLFSPDVLMKRGYQFIPNGIQTERFCFDESVRIAARQQLGLNNEFVIGNIGRLCYQKNQEFLLEVFAKVQANQPDSRLLLVGEGDAETALKQRARQLGIDRKVIFYGTSNRPEQLYAAMDVFAFPSRFEGLGIVAVEAQNAGLPVVCSEYVPPEARVTGYLEAVPLADGAGVWAKKLLSCSSPSREEGKQSVQAAGFDIKDVAQKVRAVYGGTGVC